MLEIRENGTAQAWVVLSPDNTIAFRLLFASKKTAWRSLTWYPESKIPALKAEGWRVKRVTITVESE